MNRANPIRMVVLAATSAIVMVSHSLACTRAVFVGEDRAVITGRTMDWKEDMRTNLWVLPKGIARDGAAGTNSPLGALCWTISRQSPRQ